MTGEDPASFARAARVGISRRDEIAEDVQAEPKRKTTERRNAKRRLASSINRLRRIYRLGSPKIGEFIIDFAVRLDKPPTVAAQSRRLVDRLDKEPLTATGGIEFPPSPIRLVRQAHPADLAES
jgi:hypothetical protein